MEMMLKMIIKWGLILLIGYIALKQKVTRQFLRKYWPWIAVSLLGYYVGKSVGVH